MVHVEDLFFVCHDNGIEVRYVNVSADENYMRIALTKAQEAFHQGEVPIGAVVVDKLGQVLGYGHNQRELWRDPTAHAELIALRDAARRHGDWRLAGCTLYVTVEPCIMCAGAISLSRILRVVFGTVNTKGGALGSAANVYEMAGLNHYPIITSGVLSSECGMIMKDFFAMRRDVRVVEGARLESE